MPANQTKKFEILQLCQLFVIIKNIWYSMTVKTNDYTQIKKGQKVIENRYDY